VLPAPSVVLQTLVGDWPVLSESLLTTLTTTLEAFLAYAHEQGVTRRRLACEELFPKEVSFEVRI